MSLPIDGNLTEEEFALIVNAPEITKDFIHLPVMDHNLINPKSIRTITLSESQGIMALIGKLKSGSDNKTHIITYLFERSKGWDMKKAKAWVKRHHSASVEATHDIVEVVASAQLVEVTDRIEISDKLLLLASVPLDQVSLAEKDFFFLENWMLHTNVPNSNSDGFIPADIEEIVRTNQFSIQSPVIIDVNHRLPGIGFSYQAFPADDNGVLGLKARSVICNWGNFHDLGSAIIELAKAGQLYFSMSCRPDYIMCSQCGAIAKSLDQYCEHLLNKKESGAIRWLRHPVFLSNSIIFPPNVPADRAARLISIVDDLNKKEDLLTKVATAKEGDMDELEETADLEEAAKWTRAYIDTLEDDCFATVEPGYPKQTSDKSARHLPHHPKGHGNGSGSVQLDLPHYKNALARCNQIIPVTKSISAADLGSKAEKHLQAHQGLFKKETGGTNLEEENMKELEDRIKALELELSKAKEESKTAVDTATASVTKLTEELNTLKAEKDALVKEKEALTAEKATVVKEKETLAGEKDALVKEKEVLLAEKVEMAKQIDAFKTAEADGAKQAKATSEASRRKQVEALKLTLEENEKALVDKQVVNCSDEEWATYFNILVKTKGIDPKVLASELLKGAGGSLDTEIDSKAKALPNLTAVLNERQKK